MERPILGMLLIGAACLTISLPASATPKVGGHDNGLSICDEQALHLYAQGAKAGLDVGRNRVDDGKLLQSGKAIPEPHPCEWRDKLDVMLHPPVVREPIAESSPAPVASTPTTTVAPTSDGSYSIPSYIVECESGGDYGASNGSGAYGAYQIMPGTASAYGCDLSTPAGQDSCAAEIYAAEGASPWACG